MKKIILSLIVCFTLVGCSTRAQDLTHTLDSVVETNLNQEGLTGNHSKKYLKYYVPKNIGVLDQDMTSTIFKYDNNQFLMSINVASIISDGSFSYRSPLDLSNAYYVKEGTFVDKNNDTLDYCLSLLPLEGKYYIVLNSTYLSFYGYANAIDSIEIINAMTKILKSSMIVKDKLIENFDREERQKSEKISLDLFNEVIPSSGRLEDIVDGIIPATQEPVPTETPVSSLDPQESAIPTEPPYNDIYQEQGEMLPQ